MLSSPAYDHTRPQALGNPARGVADIGTRVTTGLRLAWVLVAFFCAVSPPFADLAEVVTDIEAAAGVRVFTDLLGGVAHSVQVRYLAYGFALIIGAWSIRGLADFRSSVVLWLCAYTGWALASALWAVSPAFAAVKAAALLSAVLVTVALVGRPGGPEVLVKTTIGTGAAVLLSAMAVAAVFPDLGLTPYPGWYSRLGGQFAGPNGLGQYAGILLILVWCWPTRWRTSIRAALIALSVVALIWTQSRTSMAAAIAALALVEFLRANVGVRALVVATGSVALLGLVVANVDLGGFVEFFARGSAAEPYEMLRLRAELWPYALELVADSPILGYGFAAGSRVLLNRVIWWWEPFQAHNLLIEALLNLGAVGLLLLSLLVVSLLPPLARLTRREGLERNQGLTGLGLLSLLLVAGITESSFAGELSIAFIGLLVTVAIAVLAGQGDAGARGARSWWR